LILDRNRFLDSFKNGCRTGRFTTTIAVINSAIVKLSYVTDLAVSRKLYRGIQGMSVPDVLLRMQGKSSFVDFAFSSATPEKEVAMVSAIY
jgi:hypothetical protein